MTDKTTQQPAPIQSAELAELRKLAQAVIDTESASHNDHYLAIDNFETAAGPRTVLRLLDALELMEAWRNAAEVAQVAAAPSIASQRQVSAGGVLEGWKLVPIEPTENMIIDGFESVPGPVFVPEHWDEYEQMSGCQQAAMRARLCYAAMLAAAPVAPHQESAA